MAAQKKGKGGSNTALYQKVGIITVAIAVVLAAFNREGGFQAAWKEVFPIAEHLLASALILALVITGFKRMVQGLWK